MRNTLTIILLLTTLLLNAQNALKNDSAFQAKVAAERLTDSTDLDRIKTLYIDAIRYKELSKTSGNRELLLITLENLEKSIRLQDSLNIPAPSYYAAACFQLGLFYLSSQNQFLAYININNAHKYDPTNTEYIEYLVYLCENSSDPKLNKQAIKHLENLRKFSPYNSSYCLHLLNLYSNEGKYKKAYRELDAYRKLEGESINSLQYELAILYQSGNEKSIPTIFAEYIKRNPMDQSNAEMLLASYYCQTNQYDDAFYLLYRNLDHVTDFDLTKLLNPYIATYFERKDTASAYTLLDSIQSLHPSDIEVFQYSLNVYEVLRDTSAIMMALNNICKLDHQNQDAYRTLLEIYSARNMNDSVRIIASKGHDLFQNDDWTYFHIVSLATDSTLADSLIRVCRRAILTAQQPQMKGVAYLFIGDFMMQHDSLQSALTAYDSCLVYIPDNSYALNNYSYTLATSPNVSPEDLARSEKMAALAMKLDPSSSAILDTYAWILFLRGDAVSARMYYERLIRMYADNKAELDAVSCYHIYSVFRELGYADEANKYLEKARDFYQKNPNSVREQKIIDLLKQTH